jgi:hypothetical protein
MLLRVTPEARHDFVNRGIGAATTRLLVRYTGDKTLSPDERQERYMSKAARAMILALACAGGLVACASTTTADDNNTASKQVLNQGAAGQGGGGGGGGGY